MRVAVDCKDNWLTKLDKSDAFRQVQISNPLRPQKGQNSIQILAKRTRQGENKGKRRPPPQILR